MIQHQATASSKNNCYAFQPYYRFVTIPLALINMQSPSIRFRSRRQLYRMFLAIMTASNPPLIAPHHQPFRPRYNRSIHEAAIFNSICADRSAPSSSIAGTATPRPVSEIATLPEQPSNRLAL
jgi:hypothetical protein